MALTQLAPPYPIFTDKNGDPLDNGYLYFGVVNQNPETTPVQVYYDSALTQPAAQPLRTSNGYVMRNGSPALIYADNQFSITIRNKNEELVLYSPAGFGVVPFAPVTFATSDRVVKDVATLLADVQFTYAAGVPNTVQVFPGDIIRTLAEGFAYEVALSSATDEHVTTAGGVKLYVTAVSEISAAAFGAVGDGVTDNGPAFLAMTQYLRETPPDILSFPEGSYVSTEVLRNSRGTRVVGQGNVVFIPSGNKGIYAVGTGGGPGGGVPGGNDPARIIPLPIANLTKGQTSIVLASSPTNLAAGDVIIAASGLSANSSGTNNIWLYKDWVRVKAVKGAAVYLDTPMRYAHNLTDNFLFEKVLCNGGSTENIRISVVASDDLAAGPGLFTGNYPWWVAEAVGHEFADFACQESANYVVLADAISFRRCDIQGFNSGSSVARGTGRVSYYDCTLRTGVRQPGGTGIFNEETPDSVVCFNCDVYGRISAVSSADLVPPKIMKFIGGRVFSPGATQAIAAAGFYNSDGFALELEGVEIHSPGGVYEGIKTVIGMRFADSLRVVNCKFIGIAADAYTVSATSIGSFRLSYHGNVEGGGLGVHSSLSTIATNLKYSFGSARLAASGLEFPALALPSADPNTIDDYEEGTFDPTLATFGGVPFVSVTYGAERVGQYVKVGRLVFIKIRMHTAAVDKTLSTGGVNVGNLPFVPMPNAGSVKQGSFAFVVSEASGWLASSPLSAAIEGGAQIFLKKRAAIGGDDVTLGAALDVNTGDGNKATISGWYLTAT